MRLLFAVSGLCCILSASTPLVVGRCATKSQFCFSLTSPLTQYSDRCIFVRGPPELVPQTIQRVKGAHPKDHNTNFDQHTFDQKIVLCKMCFSKKHNNVCQSYSLNIPKCLPKRPQHILQKSWRPAQKKHTRLARGCISTFGLDGHGDLPA